MHIYIYMASRNTGLTAYDVFLDNEQYKKTKGLVGTTHRVSRILLTWKGRVLRTISFSSIICNILLLWNY